jgi:hypothetical protein
MEKGIFMIDGAHSFVVSIRKAVKVGLCADWLLSKHSDAAGTSSKSNRLEADAHCPRSIQAHSRARHNVRLLFRRLPTVGKLLVGLQ